MRANRCREQYSRKDIDEDRTQQNSSGETGEENMRKRLYEIVEIAKEGDKISDAYDMMMFVVIILSLIPLAFKEITPLLHQIELVTAGVFVIDYLARWITADYRLKKGALSFLIHPFTPIAIVDLLSILPVLSVIYRGFGIFKLFRLGRIIRVFRIFRYSKNYRIISEVIKKQKEALIMVCILAGTYLLFCALVVFNVEPDTFDTFFDALYWATISLTTVGYGDIYPVTRIGRVITMISALIGIAVVALPAGIITAGYMEEVNKVHVENAADTDRDSSSAAEGAGSSCRQTEEKEETNET